MLPGSAHTRSAASASRGAAPSATAPVASAAVSASPPLFHVVMRLGPSVSRALRLAGAPAAGRARALPASSTTPSLRLVFLFPSSSSSLLNREGIERSTLRDHAQSRGLGHGGRPDGAELVIEIEPRRDRQPDPPAYAAPHGDVLLAVDAVGDRVADDSRAQPPLPQHLAAVAIDRAEVTIQAAVERQPAVGDQRTTPVRVGIRNLPDGLAGQRVVLLELAGDSRFLRIHEHVREHVHGTLLGV